MQTFYVPIFLGVFLNDGWKFLLGGCALSLAIAIRDTPDIWQKIKAAPTRRKKVWPVCNLLLHWSAVIITGIGAVVSQIGSDDSEQELKDLRANQIQTSNLWATATVELLSTRSALEQTKQQLSDVRKTATETRDLLGESNTVARLNETKTTLAEANKVAAVVRDVVANSNIVELAKLPGRLDRQLKPIKERLIDFLNSADARILQRLSNSPTSITYLSSMTTIQVSDLKKLANETGAWQYVQSVKSSDDVLKFTSAGMAVDVEFVLYPALLKPD